MAKATDQTKPTKAIIHQKQTKQPSWSTMRSLFAFKNHPNIPQQHKQQKQKQKQEEKTEQLKQKPKKKLQKPRLDQHKQTKEKQKQKLHEQAAEETSKKCKKMRCSGSLCSNTKVVHRPETSLSPETAKKTRANSTDASSASANSNRFMKAPSRELNANKGGAFLSSYSLSSASNASVGIGGSFRGMPFRRFYGCYECRMVVDPVLGITKNSSLRTTIRSCPHCGEIFMNAENLELHQAVRHAVSEVGAEDTSKNIVEIIFQSSWLKKQTPICRIDRILKVHNTQTTISKFEEYRDFIKSKATRVPKKNPRCVADGNELLRFHCTTVSCPLGLNGSTNLCNSIPSCHVCSVIKNGFKIDQEKGKVGILTTATSGRAHDSGSAVAGAEGKRAMLVCRVIAGRVRKVGNGELNHTIDDNNNNKNVGEEYDSVAGEIGVYSNLDELYVFNPKAILPCFVVIYSL